jgi:8-oxo-dGTP pyrophosphatase MutT (NUDIX family)
MAEKDEISALTERIRTALTHRHPNDLKVSGKTPGAAVSVMLRPGVRMEELEVLLVKRKTREGDPWSGQMAFPGGRKKIEDVDLSATAIRETREEVGVDLTRSILLGTMSDVVSSGLSISVKPFIFFTKAGTLIRLNPEELIEYFWIPLSFFRDRSNVSNYAIVRFGSEVRVPSYTLHGGNVIWGLTFRIINNFLSDTGLGI